MLLECKMIILFSLHWSDMPHFWLSTDKELGACVALCQFHQRKDGICCIRLSPLFVLEALEPLCSMVLSSFYRWDFIPVILFSCLSINANLGSELDIVWLTNTACCQEAVVEFCFAWLFGAEIQLLIIVAKWDVCPVDCNATTLGVWPCWHILR